MQGNKFRHRKSLRLRNRLRKTKKIMKGGEGEYLLLCEDPECNVITDMGDKYRPVDINNLIMKYGDRFDIAVSNKYGNIIGKITDINIYNLNEYIVKNKDNKTVGYFDLKKKKYRRDKIYEATKKKRIEEREEKQELFRHKKNIKKYNNNNKKNTIQSSAKTPSFVSTSAPSSASAPRSATALRSFLPSAQLIKSASVSDIAQKQLDEMFSRLNRK